MYYQWRINHGPESLTLLCQTSSFCHVVACKLDLLVLLWMAGHTLGRQSGRSGQGECLAAWKGLTLHIIVRWINCFVPHISMCDLVQSSNRSLKYFTLCLVFSLTF